jgi:ectoine hydroxylase-related dioxygenase (phytanoyl-CoA dioxygenase family)
MTSAERKVPSASYGVLERHGCETPLDEAAEQVRVLGYAIIESGYTAEEVADLSNAFDAAREGYIELHGRSFLQRADELNNIRMMLMHGNGAFLQMALNQNLLDTVGKLIAGKFILNQQNGVINPPNENYNQGAWHRDLPYQHFVSSTPLAINALFCIDDFTVENGATFVLPASHKSAAFPSRAYVEKNAVQIEARAGQFILLDCMMFHSGGYNGTSRMRRAVNHVYNIPYLKQQINVRKSIDGAGLSPQARQILGFDFQEPDSVADYLASRKK